MITTGFTNRSNYKKFKPKLMAELKFGPASSLFKSLTKSKFVQNKINFTQIIKTLDKKIS